MTSGIEKQGTKNPPKATKKPLRPNRCLSPTFCQMSRKLYLDPSYQRSMPWKPSLSNKDKKANMERQLWSSLADSRSGLVLQALSKFFLSRPIQASGKATPTTLYIFCTNITGVFPWMGWTRQECFISHPQLHKTQFLLRLSEHAPWTTWKKITFKKGNALLHRREW